MKTVFSSFPKKTNKVTILSISFVLLRLKKNNRSPTININLNPFDEVGCPNAKVNQVYIVMMTCDSNFK